MQPGKTDRQPGKTDRQPGKTDRQPGKTDRQPGTTQKHGGFGLDHAEAVADGTALIGGDPNRTRAGNRPVSAETIGQDWHRISTRLAELFAAGIADNDPRTQQAIHDHYRWICHFWTPDRDSYLRLAGMYVNQPKFRKRIERRKPTGLAAYMRDAMTAYAWSRLR